MAAQQQQQQQGGGGYNQTPEFFLSNYRLGKTLGIGSFGKAGRPRCRLRLHVHRGCMTVQALTGVLAPRAVPGAMQGALR
jgi:hypothetical protein